MSGPVGAVRLDLPSEASVLSVVRAAVRAVAEDRAHVRLELRELDEVAVAVQEACTNAIRHAHAGDPTRRFQVEIHRHTDALEILVRDTGAPFQMEARVSPPEALCEHGYGIRIMRSWMDEVSVRREDEHNVVRLVRRYRIAAGAQRAVAR